MRKMLLAALLVARSAVAADYTRDGGTADWQCCADKACATIISQHADAVRAEKACGKLTDADGKTRWIRSHAFRITSAVVVPPPPQPTPGSATISWTPPTTNTDGSALTNLAGYYIQYGTAPNALNQSVKVDGAGVTSRTITGLAAGTWYFAVEAYTAGNPSLISERSAAAQKVVQ